MMSSAWYQLAEATEPLAQGDIILDCPVFTIGSDLGEILVSENGSLEDEDVDFDEVVSAESADVVVMTQACDLEQGKVQNVVLCPARGLSEYKEDWEQQQREQGQNPTLRSWASHFKNVRDGFVWNLTVINDARIDEQELEMRVVDFHEVFSVPREVIERVLKKRGVSRFRLNPPYREHLSQSFARFFMRVGLPVPVSEPST
jgi:hypothetical protein